jgi:glycerophosphoryl diester phosphodiesterase
VSAAASAAAATPAIQAHRGGSVLGGVPRFPEDTMPAFANAIRRERVTIELDVKLTADGVAVVIHDDSLDRTTACTGLVRDLALAQLAGCPSDVLGTPGGALRSRTTTPTVRISRLVDVLAFARRHRGRVSMEIKNVPTDRDFDATPAYANRVMDAVIAARFPKRRLIVQSFIPANLDVARSRLRGVATSFLTLAGFNDGGLDQARRSRYTWISPQWPVSGAYVRRAHRAKLKVVPYTLDTRAQVRAAARAGVDALITDDPVMARRALRKRRS